MAYICDKKNNMTENELSYDEIQQTAAVFKCLSHTAKITILKYLAKVKVNITEDISDKLSLSKPTIHLHLAELKKHDLIKGEILGTHINYCINYTKIKNLKINMDKFFSDLNI